MSQGRRRFPPGERGEGQCQIVAGDLIAPLQEANLSAVGPGVDIVGLCLKDSVVGTLGLIEGAPELQADAPSKQYQGFVLGPEEDQEVIEPQGIVECLVADLPTRVPEQVGAIGPTQPEESAQGRAVPEPSSKPAGRQGAVKHHA
jgi:hypothetical protein